MTKQQFDEQLAKAQKRVSNYDAIDGTQDRLAGTIYAALVCGIMHPETGAQFDAAAMLRDVARIQSPKNNPKNN